MGGHAPNTWEQSRNRSPPRPLHVAWSPPLSPDIEGRGNQMTGWAKELTIAIEVNGLSLAVTHTCELGEIGVADLSNLAGLYHAGAI